MEYGHIHNRRPGSNENNENASSIAIQGTPKLDKLFPYILTFINLSIVVLSFFIVKKLLKENKIERAQKKDKRNRKRERKGHRKPTRRVGKFKKRLSKSMNQSKDASASRASANSFSSNLSETSSISSWDTDLDSEYTCDSEIDYSTIETSYLDEDPSNFGIKNVLEGMTRSLLLYSPTLRRHHLSRASNTGIKPLSISSPVLVGSNANGMTSCPLAPTNHNFHRQNSTRFSNKSLMNRNSTFLVPPSQKALPGGRLSPVINSFRTVSRVRTSASEGCQNVRGGRLSDRVSICDLSVTKFSSSGEDFFEK